MINETNGPKPATTDGMAMSNMLMSRVAHNNNGLEHSSGSSRSHEHEMNSEDLRLPTTV